MKSLQEALVDYDIAQLQSLAAKRGATPPDNRNREALATLADELLSPVSVTIALDDLSAEERAALQDLMASGGFIEARKFTRRHGSLRPMGSNRLQRQKPWESPQNATEGLWYRALVCKGFHHTVNGPEEIYFVPNDVQSLLPADTAGEASPAPPFHVSLSSAPKQVQEASQAAREDLFTLLVYLQSTIVRPAEDDTIPDENRQQMQAEFSFPPESASKEERDHWFDFVLQLARRLDFLRKQGGRLRLNSEAVRVWLQKSAWAQSMELQQTWRSDPTWNDLWHIPGLHPRPTGWDNSPMLGRSKILHYLAQLPIEEWIGLETFTQAVKKTEPDFQRPDGDYQSWYIYTANGDPLMGFEHWDDVEGAFIRHLVTRVLFALGAVNLGTPTADMPPRVFQISALGAAMLKPKSAEEPPVPADAVLHINPTDFTVRVPASLSLYDRFQLARFSSLARRESKRIIYQITRQSYRRALEQSITLEQILAFLTRATNAKTPLSLVETMRNWDRRTGSAKLESLTVLRVNQEDMIAELVNHPQIGPLLGQPIGPTEIVVPKKNLPALRKLLEENSYLDEA